MVVSYKNELYMSGGRDNSGFGFNSDVWRSSNGTSWEIAASQPFEARGYHTMVVTGDCMVIAGGQNFGKFFSDVWRSCDGRGEVWTKLTDNAWPHRSGHASLVTVSGEMLVAGGCYKKTTFPYARSFYGDVWASTDGGVTWVQRSGESGAEWAPRSGPRLVEFNGRLLIVAGEQGFTPDVQLGDIWASDDNGRSWTEVVAAPEFARRSGHGLVVTPDGKMLQVIGGWPEFHDVWESSDGASWTQTANNVWGCAEDSKGCGKFDFWSLYHNDQLFAVGGSGAYTTFGKLYADTWRQD